MDSRPPSRIAVVSEATLAIDDDVRPQQTVELFDEQNRLLARYSRFLNPAGTAWIRHGVWQQFAPNGRVVSQGGFMRGAEHGVWRDFHENGQLAAEGQYDNGREVGAWNFWDPNGNPEQG